MPSSHSDQPLEQLIERALEIQDRGDPIDFTTLCGDTPELEPVLREALAGRQLIADWSRPPMDDRMAGRRIANRYELVERIGLGAMGAVYRARDLELERDVAVKVMQSHTLTRPDATQRFLREARTMATLHHPNVVPVHDRGVTDDGLQYLVMELLSGLPLSRLLAEAEQRRDGRGIDSVRSTGWMTETLKTTPTETSYVRCCAQWTANLASGLSAAHAVGVVHRDVKPSNVFVTSDGSVHLLDFGVAAQESDGTLTVGDARLGTPVYMAPEHVAGTADRSPQLDVYSLTATLYHMLAMQAPYQGTVSTVLAAIQAGGPTPIRRLHPGLPRDLRAIVECGMERDPKHRYGTVAELEADLTAFLSDRPIRARKPPVVERTWRVLKRSRAAQAVGLAVIASVLAIVAYLAYQEYDAGIENEFAAIVGGLPPTMTLGVGRTIYDEGHRHDMFARLDRAIALRPASPVSRCLRGALRFDHEDYRGAAEDFRAIAATSGSPFTRSLAEKYDALVPSGGEAPTLASLPEPGPDDGFVAGYLAMRDRDFAAAVEYVDGEDLFSREFRLYAEFGAARLRRDFDAIAALRDPALALMALAPTTRVRYVYARALYQREEFQEAAARFEELHAETRYDYNLITDLASACRNISAPARAADLAKWAIPLRAPDGAITARNLLSKSLADQQQFEDARANADLTLEQHPDDWRALEARAYVASRRSLSLPVASEECLEALRISRTNYLRAAEIMTEAGLRADSVVTNVTVCDAVIDRNFDKLCSYLLRGLAEQPNPVHAANLARCLPNSPSETLISTLRDYFAYSSGLSPNLPTPPDITSAPDSTSTTTPERKSDDR